MKVNKAELKQHGCDVLLTEAEELRKLSNKIDEQFIQACELILESSGRVIVVGMGKSGHVGKKIAATLASTGTPAFFVHPGEASHGDLGMFTAQDVVLALSNSGSTPEILLITPLLKRLGSTLISMTGNPDSQLAQLADVHISVQVDKEACPLGLAPTSSSTAAIAMGDALAMCLLHARGFTSEDFARSHPGGALGKRLLVRIEDVMHPQNEVPKVVPTDTLKSALFEMTSKRLGMTTVVAEKDSNQIIGIFTDGDLRRAIDQEYDIHTTLVKDVMITSFKTAQPSMLASEAIHLMEKFKIFTLPVIDNNHTLVGAFNMHDLLQAGIV